MIIMTEETLFDETPEQPASQRATLAEKMCGGESPGGLLGQSPLQQAATLTSPPPTEVQGCRIGPYTLVQKIGEGGMGTVFMAEQTEPVRRLVALKVIKAGMESRQVMAHFEAERQALALMDHPNIAKVFDAGTTEEKDEGGRMKDEKEAGNRSDSSFIFHPSSFRSGLPYFVMELVNGVPITKYWTSTT
jgi:serine/threonine protein kinase